MSELSDKHEDEGVNAFAAKGGDTSPEHHDAIAAGETTQPDADYRDLGLAVVTEEDVAEASKHRGVNAVEVAAERTAPDPTEGEEVTPEDEKTSEPKPADLTKAQLDERYGAVVADWPAKGNHGAKVAAAEAHEASKA